MVKISEQKLRKQLIKEEKVTSDQFRKARLEARKEKKEIEDILIEKGLVSEQDLAKIQARLLKIPFVDLTKEVIRKDVLFQVPEPIAREHNVIAFAEDKEKLKIAMADPGDLLTQEFIRKKAGKEVEVYLASLDGIQSILKQYRRGIRAEFTEIVQKGKALKGLEDLRKIAEYLPTVRIVDTILDYGVYEDASDIHIEPREDKLLVRYRIDGILHDVIALPKETMPGIVARIKILAKLKIDEHRLPQDGRFKILKKGYKASFRVSILPVLEGEKVVMRILPEEERILILEQLGLQHSTLETAKEGISLPAGMILVCGPTGCGKTTTLYSILNILNTPKVNIATIEDPIEYRVPRVNQSQVRPKIGYTFATGLRTLVRQDPDIIMVGEIRDLETAEIAIHSALTGHLVLSTLHTTNAAGALTRLVDMGIKPFLVTSTCNMIIGQRLVRKICTKCIEKYRLSKEEIESLRKVFNIEQAMKVLERERIIKPQTPISGLDFFRGKGCDRCRGEGYKGRIGIFEVLKVTKAVSDLVLKEAPTEEIEKQAEKEGMITMIQDGFLKAKCGITTLEEVLRVVK